MKNEMITIPAIKEFSSYSIPTIAEWINRQNKRHIKLKYVKLDRYNIPWVTRREGLIISIGLYLNCNFLHAQRIYYRAKKTIMEHKNEK